MCGIVGAFSKTEDVNEFILNQYEDQEHRGSKGFGAVFIKEDNTFDVKRATEPIKALIDLNLNPSRMVLFHHRFPTSSANKINQTHPILVENGSLKNDYLVIHNGVLSNDDQLLKEHEELGFIYTTKTANQFNDSECVAIEVARFMEKQIDELNLQGSCAFVALQIDRESKKIIKTVYGTNGSNPIKAHLAPGKVFLSSEGIGTTITKDILYTINMKTFKVTQSPMNFTVKEKTTFLKPIEYEKDYTPYDSKDYNYGYKKTPIHNNHEYASQPKLLDEQKTPIITEKSITNYEDIIEDLHIQMGTVLDNFYEYLTETDYGSESEVEDTIQKIRKIFYHAEVRAMDRTIEVEAIEEEGLFQAEEYKFDHATD